ncbi:MAG: hypothetical protein GX414_16560, partial [Acidobacteria bacterium]|nr:hypothetical protein [Acidobacteriota bacterium]
MDRGQGFEKKGFVVVSRPSSRRIVRIQGIVQGVGFRPFIHRLAIELGLSGSVCNDAGGVLVDVEG